MGTSAFASLPHRRGPFRGGVEQAGRESEHDAFQSPSAKAFSVSIECYDTFLYISNIDSGRAAVYAPWPIPNPNPYKYNGAEQAGVVLSAIVISAGIAAADYIILSGKRGKK